MKHESSIILNGFEETVTFPGIMGMASEGNSEYGVASTLENTIALPKEMVG